MRAGRRHELPDARRARDRHRIRVERAFDHRQAARSRAACRASRPRRRCSRDSAGCDRSCARRSRAATTYHCSHFATSGSSMSGIAKPRRMRSQRSSAGGGSGSSSAIARRAAADGDGRAARARQPARRARRRERARDRARRRSGGGLGVAHAASERREREGKQRKKAWSQLDRSWALEAAAMVGGARASVNLGGRRNARRARVHVAANSRDDRAQLSVNGGDGDNRRHGRIFRSVGPGVDDRSPTGSRRRSDAICSRASRPGSTGPSPTSSASRRSRSACRSARSSRKAASPRAGPSIPSAPAELLADPHWLPFPENSLDLIVLPHALEFTSDPHQLLREVYRAMRAEGQIVISGFNPFSLFGAKRYFGRGAVAAVERQLHRAVPAQGLARAARLRSDRRRRSTATCRRSRTRNGARGSAFSRPPATAGGRSAAASTTCARRRRSSACASSRRRGSTARTASPPRRGRRASASSASNEPRRPRCERSASERGRLDLHRRRVQGQSRARRLGRAARRSATARRSSSAASPPPPTIGWS